MCWQRITRVRRLRKNKQQGQNAMSDIETHHIVAPLIELQTHDEEKVLQLREERIEISINRYGQVTVTGTIMEYSDLKQQFNFAFRTDQTVLEPLIRDLARL
jgi:hypothetical protein